MKDDQNGIPNWKRLELDFDQLKNSCVFSSVALLSPSLFVNIYLHTETSQDAWEDSLHSVNNGDYVNCENIFSCNRGHKIRKKKTLTILAHITFAFSFPNYTPNSFTTPNPETSKRRILLKANILLLCFIKSKKSFIKRRKKFKK